MSLESKAEATRILLRRTQGFFLLYPKVTELIVGSRGWEETSMLKVLNHQSVKDLSPWVVNLCDITGEILYTNISSKQLPFVQEIWRSKEKHPRTLNQIIVELEIDIKPAEELRKKFRKAKAMEARFFPASMLFDLDKLESKFFTSFKHHFQVKHDYSKREYMIGASEDLIKYLGENTSHIVLAQNRNGKDEPNLNFLIRGILREKKYHVDSFIRDIYSPLEIEKDYDKIIKSVGHFKQTINKKCKPFIDYHISNVGSLLRYSCEDPDSYLDLILYDKNTRTFSFNYKILNLDPFQ